MKTKSKLNFDELNRLYDVDVDVEVKENKPRTFPTPIPYRDYFGVMYITPEEMNKRVELAEEIEDVMFWLFAYLIIAEDADISVEEVKRDATDRLTSVVEKQTVLDPYLEKHINDVINEVVDVTQKHIKRKEDEDEEDDVLSEFTNESGESPTKPQDYWTSRERAMLISENEANAFYNYEDYRKAKAQGKTKKTWITELDEKVRFTHTLEEGKTIDIDGLFLVGGSPMRFPKDCEYDPSPSEVVNCRCACEYS